MKYAASIIALLVHAYSAYGQQKAYLISGDFRNTKFTEMVESIESNSPYRFYYKPKDVDTLKVNLQANELTIQSVLNNVLEDSGLSFSLISSHTVIITTGVQIRPELPIGFFDINSSAPVELDVAALNFVDGSKSIKKNGNKISIEDQLFEIGEISKLVEGKKINLAGYIRAEQSGEAIVGAVVYIEEPMIGVITDAFGYYNISLVQGRHTLKIRSVSMEATERQIMLFSEGTLDIELFEDIIGLKEVVIRADRSANIRGVQMGIEKMDIADLKQVPTVLGEMDIAKIALTLPGVQSVGEGSSGFNVRGGAADQNLVLMNDAIIYNPSHFFGFFSIFNPDIIKSATLLKGGIPAQYGGRVSSIFEVKSRDGNKKKFGGRGGISPVTARLTFEGPIISNKTSFIVGGRSTYSDWLLRQVPDANIKNSSANFYDISAKISHEFSDKDAIFLSSYFSKDKFKLFSDSLYQYQNFNTSLQWKHNFSNKLIASASGSYSSYKYEISQKADTTRSFDLNYNLASTEIKLNFSYFPSSNNQIDFGVSSILYNLEPGNLLPKLEASEVKPIVLEPESGLESAIYLGDNFNLSNNLSIYIGLRYSIYNYLGPKTVYYYHPDLPRNPSNTIDTVFYDDNKVIQTYHGPEYRASIRYILNNFSSIKFSYNRMRQYIQMLTNTAAISPTDVWKLSDTHIKPQVGDQVSLGYYRNLRNNSIETYVEAYYKEVQDILEFKGGARLLLNDQIETDLLNGQNKSYGIEFLIRKKSGKLNGWISYTYSRSWNKVDKSFSGEIINDGEYFPANYDKPNNLNIIANYKFSRRLNISSNFVYSTGRPITYPVARYSLGNSERIYYSNRNEFRIPDYIRLDLSLQVEGNHKVDKPVHSSWSFSIYNVLSRKNVYSIYFVSEGGEVKGYKLSVFGSAIPTITYNFRF